MQLQFALAIDGYVSDLRRYREEALMQSRVGHMSGGSEIGVTAACDCSAKSAALEVENDVDPSAGSTILVRKRGLTEAFGLVVCGATRCALRDPRLLPLRAATRPPSDLTCAVAA